MLQDLATGAAAQDIDIPNVPVGTYRVLVSGFTAEGVLVGTREVEVTVLQDQLATVLISSLFEPGPTREIGLLDVSNNGVAANGSAGRIRLSSDGRYVVYTSNATNLVAGDTNGLQDIFMRDRSAATTFRISPNNTTNFSVDGYDDPSVSDSGRFVVFQEFGEQNAPLQTFGKIFVHDRGVPGSGPVPLQGSSAKAGDIPPSTTLVSTGGLPGFSNTSNNSGDRPFLSADGQHVVYRNTVGFLNGQRPYPIVMRNWVAGTTEIVSLGLNGELNDLRSQDPTCSADGRFVCFSSFAQNLIVNPPPAFLAPPGSVPPNDSPTGGGVYVRDRTLGTTRLIDQPNNPNTSKGTVPCISADGQWVANLDAGQLRLIEVATANKTTIVNSGVFGQPSISNDGKVIAFCCTAALVPNDTNGVGDCYTWDQTTNLFSRVNVAPDGTAVQGGVIDNGQAGQGPGLSGNGRRVGFASADSLLVPGDLNGQADVFSANVPTRGKLYVSNNNGAVKSIDRYDGACLPGAVQNLTRQSFTSAAMDDPGCILLDSTNDRLYVADSNPNEILVFNSASTKTGAVTPDRRIRVPVKPFDMALDPTRDILYITTGSSPQGIQSFNTISALNSPSNIVTPNRIIFTTGANPCMGLFLDSRRNEVYGGTQTINQVSVYESASTANGTINPIRTLVGPNTLLTRQVVDLEMDASPIGSTTGNRANLMALVGLDDPRVNTYPGSGSGLNQLLNDLAPLFSINGAPTNIRNNSVQNRMVVDRNTGDVYVAANTSDDRVLVFQHGRTGNVAPDRTLILQPCNIRGLALDRTR